MAAAEVTISGILYDKVNRTMQNVVLIGEATLTGAGIGGGPIIPEGPPPGIWPSPGHPAHPIAPGGRPPGFWGGVAPPYPDQGLPLPQPPTEPPPGGGDKPPPEGGGWGYVAEWSQWGYFPSGTQPGPK
jgi:hypothetical protein